MQGQWVKLLREPLLSSTPPAATRVARIVLLLVWLAFAAWLTWTHVPWRDEARAWSLMQMGTSWPDMFRTVHGEGHPYLWYIILRAGWDLFGVRQVLPVAGFLIGVAATALLVLRAPFRLGAIAVMIFSAWLGFEYVAVARNYGMAVLVMFVIAALWPRIRDSLWLGVLLLVWCNTNVPSVVLAGAMFLYRTLELWSEQSPRRSPEWGRWLGNAALSLVGVGLCFIAIYPPPTDAAAVAQSQSLTALNLLLALISSQRSFIDFGFGELSMVSQLYLWGALLMFARRPPAFLAALVGLVGLKLFFFFVYWGFYRHSAQFLAFMVALAWIEATKRKSAPADGDTAASTRIGGSIFLILLAAQSLMWITQPVVSTFRGIPYSNAANLAALLDRPEYRGATVMIDPDTYGEALVYQTGRPFWMIHQDRPGTVVPLVSSKGPPLMYDQLVAKAAILHRQTGRPVIIALRIPIDQVNSGSFAMIYADQTRLTPQSVATFLANTRRIARFPLAQTDEHFDVYVYPR